MLEDSGRELAQMQSGLERRRIDRVGLVGKLCGDLVMLSLASTAPQAVEDCADSVTSTS